jgi:hypothetical protein
MRIRVTKRAPASLAAALRRQSGERPRKGTAAPGEMLRISHNAAFRKAAAFTALRSVRCNGRSVALRALRVRGTWRYVWRPGTAAKTEACAGARKVSVRVTVRARASRRRRASPSVRRHARAKRTATASPCFTSCLVCPRAAGTSHHATAGQANDARSCVACSRASPSAWRLRRRQRHSNINRVLHAVQAINPLAPHWPACLLHRRQGQALRALRGLDGAKRGGARTALWFWKNGTRRARIAPQALS